MLNKNKDELQKIIYKVTLNDPELKELNLMGCYITVESVKQLAEALKLNHVVTHVHLAANMIEDLGCQSIASMLTINKTINWLHVGANNIGPDGGEWIAAALVLNTSLEYLNLDWNRFSDNGAKFIDIALGFNSTLKELSLIGNGIKNKDVLINFKSHYGNIEVERVPGQSHEDVHHTALSKAVSRLRSGEEPRISTTVRIGESELIN